MQFFVLLLSVLLFSCTGSKSRDPLEGLHKMTLEEQVKRPVTLQASIPAYTQEGEKIGKKDWGQYLTDRRYEKEFYSDEKGAVKAVVFRKKSPVEAKPERQSEPGYEGRPAIDFAATDMQGNRVELSALKGKVVVLNFWFINCKPCVLEMPQLNALRTEFGDEVVFLAATFDEREKVKTFLKQRPFTFAVLPDAGEVCRQWGVNVFPTSVVIDQNGTVRLQKVGYDKNIGQTLGNTIRQLRQVSLQTGTGTM